MSCALRIGSGYDAHRFVEGRPLILGGVRIDYPRGLQGHSDADVLLHAIGDALLGAMALGDLGVHFPPGDPAWKNAASTNILQKIQELVAAEGGSVVNVDATVVAQEPRLSGTIASMREATAAALGVDVSRVSLKATTTEGMGFAGRREGIAAYATVLVETG